MHRSLITPFQLFSIAVMLVLLAIGICNTQAEEIHSFEITLVNGDVSGDEDVIRVLEGDQVEIAWTSDKALDIHLHGYDVQMILVAGQRKIMSLTAHFTGRFPIEVHGTGLGHGSVVYFEVLPK